MIKQSNLAKKFPSFDEWLSPFTASCPKRKKKNKKKVCSHHSIMELPGSYFHLPTFYFSWTPSIFTTKFDRMRKPCSSLPQQWSFIGSQAASKKKKLKLQTKPPWLTRSQLVQDGAAGDTGTAAQHRQTGSCRKNKLKASRTITPNNPWNAHQDMQLVQESGYNEQSFSKSTRERGPPLKLKQEVSMIRINCANFSPT